MAKYVYISSDWDDGWYVDQTAVAWLSVRKIDPTARCVVLTDAKTAEMAPKSIQRLQSTGATVQIESTDLPTAVATSRFLKTGVVGLVEPPFWTLDSDTLMLRPLGEVRLDQGQAIAAVHDRNHKSGDLIRPEDALSAIDRTSFDQMPRHYYNSGVIYWSSNSMATEIGNRWHHDWMAQYQATGEHRDQYTFNLCLADMNDPVCLLDPTFNSLAINQDNFRVDTKILHFYASLAKRSSRSVMNALTETFRQTGKLDDSILLTATKSHLVWASGVRWELARRNWRGLAKELQRKYLQSTAATSN
ncbi:hypothetical protein NHH03_02930 [Stieleria sp. TO1_6]|uniref:hypothetical protein n=1 Tax=Stieleria tagensis TaxID=2956795 RepID=UPI00209AA9E0|nr:hypothetical protein [Stieleria tagensis]MCO8120678.1 hypothetical protein [Stieleria tagensis]